MPRGVPNVMSRNELDSRDAPIRQYAVLDLSSPSAAPMPDGQIIESIDGDMLPPSQADRLAFAEEPLDIRIEPGRERFAPTTVRLGVNGETKWVPVGTPVRLRRKFVEVLARSQPFSVRTDVGNAMVENPHNRLERQAYRQHPFTVLHDPNPIGANWLTKVMAEG